MDSLVKKETRFKVKPKFKAGNEVGFDNEKYVKEQIKAIKERAKKFDRIYLEIGGRLTYDGHAQRVLPGYDPLNKIRIIQELGKKVELLYCISSAKLEEGVKWSNTGLTLDELAIKETSLMEKNGIKVLGIVATRFKGEKKVIEFGKKLSKIGKKLFFTKEIKGYPHNMKETFGKKGFMAQEHIPAKSNIVIVTGAGANSGKMFLCLSQIYKEDKQGLNSGYAKFETFPIWNLPLNHEVNLAYEAATADIMDYNMIDPFHKKAYGKIAVNYNRDVESFPVLKKIILKIAKPSNPMHSYASPTDMGINKAKKGILNDNICRTAAKKEIIRRCEFFEKESKGKKRKKLLKRLEEIYNLANQKK